MITLAVEFEWNINGVMKEMMDCGNVDTDAGSAILDGQPQQISKDQLADISEESGCYNKDEDVLEEVTLRKKLPVKEQSEGLSRH